MTAIKPKYMLDTNMCIFLLKQQPLKVAQRFNQCKLGEVVMSAITWGELQRGLDRYQSKAQLDALASRIMILPFDSQAGVAFGKLMQNATFKASLDALIASHALSLNLTIVTNNLSDFAKFAVALEDWT